MKTNLLLLSLLSLLLVPCTGMAYTPVKNRNVAFMNSYYKEYGRYLGMMDLTIPTVAVDRNGALGLNIINGYRPCRNFAFGGGLGFIGDVIDESLYMPIYLHLRTDLQKKSRDISPYASLNIGYSIGLANGHKYACNGFFCAPSFGITYNIGTWRFATGIEFNAIHGKGSRFYEDDVYVGVNDNPSEWVMGLNLKFAVFLPVGGF